MDDFFLSKEDRQRILKDKRSAHKPTKLTPEEEEERKRKLRDGKLRFDKGTGKLEEDKF